MNSPQICTLMPCPPGLQTQANSLAVQQNPGNAHELKTGDGRLSLALPDGTKWPNGSTLRVKILNGSDKIKGKVRQYANVWTQYANIKFDFVESGHSDIRVNIGGKGGSWSYRGTDCRGAKQDEPTINFGWLTDSSTESEFSRVILHEFGHALGCIHEHQTPVANISWNKPAVYAYYEENGGWDKDEVDKNIFNVPKSCTTQFSAFDARSIMLYPIPASLTTNGFSTNWNTELSQTDKTFIANAYPTESIDHDIATFNTVEVRRSDELMSKSIKRFHFSTPYATPPSFAVGLNWIDLSRNTNIRLKAFADNITTSAADIHIETWADTTLYSAGCTWFRAAAKDPDFQVGSWNTLLHHNYDQPQKITKHQVTFARSYTAPPTVVVWLNAFDLASDKDWRLKVYATDITATGFELIFYSWGDTVTYSAGASWIAYPSTRADVTSGRFSTSNLDKKVPVNSSNIERFPDGKFSRIPTVLVALHSIDVSSSRNLRLKISVDSITPSGMVWYIDTWADTLLYEADASYIAFP